MIGERTLEDLVEEYRSTGPAYLKKIHTVVRASYSGHYRRMLPLILEALEFRSNNTVHRPVIDAIALIRQHRESRQHYFALEEAPIEGVLRKNMREIVIETDRHGVERVNRINYEIAVLGALRSKLRCKELWVVGAKRFRNPDEDLPQDDVLAIIGKRIFLDFRRPATGHANLVSGVGSAEMDRSSG